MCGAQTGACLCSSVRHELESNPRISACGLLSTYLGRHELAGSATYHVFDLREHLDRPMPAQREAAFTRLLDEIWLVSLSVRGVQ